MLPALDAGPAAEPSGERYRTHRAVRRLLEALAAAKPLVLLLDDLHWADASSVELLGTLLRRPPARRAASRCASPAPGPGAALGVARTRAAGGHADPPRARGLQPEEARRAARRGRRAPALYDESGGNPFYLQQLARAPQPAGAPTAPPACRSRASRCRRRGRRADRRAGAAAGDARRVLDGAAVAGDPFEPELAAAAAGVDEARAIDALDELLRRDLVRATDVPRRFRFRHPLVRGAVYEAAPGGWRLGAHERSAALLAERGAPAAERAHHVERSARHGDWTRWRCCARRARPACGARRRPPPSGSAPRSGCWTADAPERVPLLVALARAALASGQFQDGYDAMRESLELRPRTPCRRVRVTAAAAALEHLLGLHEEAHARLAAGARGAAGRRSPGAWRS